MSTRNFDASRVTNKMQNRTLYGYYANNTKNGTSVRPEQPTGQLNNIVVERSTGACSCTNDPLMGYNQPATTANPNPSFVNPVNFGPANNF